LGSLFILAQNLGYLLIYVCGDLMPFAAVMWMCTAVPVLHIIAFLAMPETPVFLVKQGKIKVRLISCCGQCAWTCDRGN
jgi:MFS transporter, SP family, solute carrier family 2 (facilitated glucose transporter), member 6